MCRKTLKTLTIGVTAAVCLWGRGRPALADQPLNVPFVAVDINGASGPLQTTYPTGWPAWQGWEFTNPITGGPSWSNTFDSVSVTLTAVNAIGNTGFGSRNRGEPPSANNEYLNNLYRDLFFVQYTATNGKYGEDYLQLDFSGLEPDKPYEFSIFNFDPWYASGGYAVEVTKFMAWGLESPADYPAYTPAAGGGGQAPKLARAHIAGYDPNDSNLLDAFYYTAVFTVKTDANGEVSLYGWNDSDTTGDSKHAPINGFAIGIDPNANNPSPADEETDLDLAAPLLSWQPGFWAQDANAHQLYFGTDYNEVSNADTDDTTGIYLGNPTETSYQLSTELISGRTYYWRVDEVNDANTPGYWKGPMWRFTATGLIFTRCRVKAGKTQYAEQGPDACDVSKMKDDFDMTGNVVFPSDLNDINTIDVNVVSTTDSATIYSESIDFDSAVANETGKFSYSYKIPKYTEGAITSLKMDFVRNTVKMKAKKVDLTGLRSPIQVEIGMGDTALTGEVDETLINGSRKSIPTRLLRLYDDALVVTRAKAKDGVGVNDGKLTVKGDIAVGGDMDLDTNEPNLADMEVIFTWSTATDTNVSTFTLPAGSFEQSSKGHTYKCKSAPADEGGLVTAKIDLDKCTFQVSIKETDDVYVGPGDAKFAISFATFDESDEYTIE